MAMQQSQQQQQQHGNSFTSPLAGLPKAQLYDIMSQVKALIDQNQQQARQILIDNPMLTRALFQAQIMLGMVQPPNVMLNIQQNPLQQQPAQVGPLPSVQSSQTLPAKVGAQSEPNSSQTMIPARQQQPPQPSISMPLPSIPPSTFPSQAPSGLSAPQTKSFLNVQAPSMPPVQSSQIPNVSLPAPPPPHYSTLPPHLPMAPIQLQQALQNPGLFNQSLQPPLPFHPRPVAMPPFTHQLHPQMPHTLGLQHSNAPQLLLSQPLFHSGIPPSSFLQGQPPRPSQPPGPPPQRLYQQAGSSHVGPDYGTQAGTSMQTDRGSPWGPGPSETTAAGTQLLGPPPMASGQMASCFSVQQPRTPALTPEMEKTLLQQVMSLTPEQINLLPPEQRNQVLQLQEMLR
ncbi:hypothetical protein Cni_G00223 [Canna indica]|uniref:Uncharacterized protein n=1 Tax=Canna indica TaxID=4628 RepID=A0AAQ3JMC9_9LILI|nr:hypothetical protein Cni_G00223 [Canna indica]